MVLTVLRVIGIIILVVIGIALVPITAAVMFLGMIGVLAWVTSL